MVLPAMGLLSRTFVLFKRKSPRLVAFPKRSASYIQGQSPEPRMREYFYYIDHQGQLFLDDAKVKNFITCFKDKKFLIFFFKQLRVNGTSRYQEEFPYISLCGRERNFVRCDDRPIVFTHLMREGGSGSELLAYGGGGEKLALQFQPEKLFMLPENGRVYHPAPERAGSVGLVKSALAIEFSPCFEYAASPESSPPTHFRWNHQRFELTNELARFLRPGGARGIVTGDLH
ncbi:UPF0598 protein C8orf82 homolog isoform X2 [Latimeria chalumnae]|uniref:UPF0598 protein C8orf82 homolog isoform X2 n=1 Tax=Latimeria chalumnae TaxID=7897 RepID=UPI0006D9312F|nr:PREDICTED: UPF0598 protein C8orf82 homolog [Latimeria chalumnae]|eukprot:XP_014345887.1 PREDICTED: UPF0598 protein C8orf82 homolog [Latimeria chalumnae]